MSKATRAYLKEQHVIDEAQGTIDTVTAEQGHTDLFARHPSLQVPPLPTDAGARNPECLNAETGNRTMGKGKIAGSRSNVTVPSWRGYPKPNACSGASSQASAGSGGSPSLCTHSHTHSPVSDVLVRDEDGRPVVGLAAEHDANITGDTSNGVVEIVVPPDTKPSDHHPTSQDDDGDSWSDFCPHILHEPHAPVPIVIVNRPPTGSGPPSYWCCLCNVNSSIVGPGHYHIRQFPQNIAWLSAMRYAQKSVLMFVLPLF